MSNSVTVTNFPNGLSTGDLTVSGTATFDGTVDIVGAVLEIRNLILTPTTAGNVISCDPASFTVGDVFCSIGNSGSNSGVGTTNGYITQAYNGTISTSIGIIANADATDFNGITAGAVGLFAENTDLHLSYNSDNGSFDIALTLTSADGNIEIFNELTVDGLTTINNQLNIVPTSGGNISGLNVSTNVSGQNLFAYVSNAYGTGSTGQTCGYVTGAYNGGQVGLISNGAASAYNGIAANSIGIYLTDKDLNITMNQGSGTTYITALSIDNSATGGVSILGSSNGNATAAGFVGENIWDSRADDNFLGLTSTQWSDVISITLTAGNWLINGTVEFDTSSVSSGGFTVSAGISTSSGNTSAGLAPGANQTDYSTNTSDIVIVTLNINQPYTYTFDVTTTVYLKAYGQFSGSLNAWGSIGAIRLP